MAVTTTAIVAVMKEAYVPVVFGKDGALVGYCVSHSPDEAREKTLVWVNTIRTEWGYDALDELPAGIRGSSQDCALARAIPNALSVGGATVTIPGGKLNLPPECIDFIAYFDSGKYTDLMVGMVAPSFVEVEKKFWDELKTAELEVQAKAFWNTEPKTVQAASLPSV